MNIYSVEGMLKNQEAYDIFNDIVKYGDIVAYSVKNILLAGIVYRIQNEEMTIIRLVDEKETYDFRTLDNMFRKNIMKSAADGRRFNIIKINSNAKRFILLKEILNDELTDCEKKNK